MSFGFHSYLIPFCKNFHLMLKVFHLRLFVLWPILSYLNIDQNIDKRFKTCPFASQSQVVSDLGLSSFCKAFNVTYDIKCNICNLQYIGHIYPVQYKNVLTNIDQIQIQTSQKTISGLLKFNNFINTFHC